MLPKVRPEYVLIAGLIAGSVPGCSNNNQIAAAAAKTRPVEDVGEMYRMFLLSKKAPPMKAADFAPFQDSNPDGYHAVKDGSVVVAWGVHLSDLSQEGSKDPADEILAYEKAVPEHGGAVLLKNRTVTTMTADQFKAAKLAK